MKTPPRATLAVAAVTAAALGLLSAAWLVAGTRATRQEAERLRAEPDIEARHQAAELAALIASRLEALRRSEDRRSFLDYQGPDERLVSESCEIPLDSPLALGPADPLIWTHFQIDSHGQLTLPTLGPRGPAPEARDRAREALAGQRAILEALECTDSDRLAADPGPLAASRRQRVQGSDREWIVTVGPFHWHTLDLEGRPALVALRAVARPDATLTQGFVVRGDALRELLGEPERASIRPGLPAGAGQARVRLDDQSWTVAVDSTAERGEAELRARAVERSFRRRSFAGVLGALVSGGLIVGLVWQADRLARQRAGFAAAAAHELRTPLAGLRMYGEMLGDDSGDPERRRVYARRVAGEAERLGRVVSNLLGFSRLERGVLGVRCLAGDLAAAVRQTLERIAPAVEAQGARVETSIEPGLPVVRFDPDAVHQILQNLLDNAEKYGRSSSDRTIQVRLEAVGDRARLSVRDRGPGIAPGLQRRLFRPFARRDDADGPAGLGLGLALVDALARAQGARASHHAPDGGGARFQVDFPAA